MAAGESPYPYPEKPPARSALGRIGTALGGLGLLFALAVPQTAGAWFPKAAPPPEAPPAMKRSSGATDDSAAGKLAKAAGAVKDGVARKWREWSGDVRDEAADAEAEAERKARREAYDAEIKRREWWLGASRAAGGLLGLFGVFAAGAGWASRERPGPVALGMLFGFAAMACSHIVVAGVLVFFLWIVAEGVGGSLARRKKES